MILLDKNQIDQTLGMREAIDLLQAAALHEAAGETVVSPRLTTNFGSGWMRILFAVDAVSGYFATKAYHMVRGVGVRYVISLYALHDGALVALLDGRRITDLRTGAASGVVAQKVPIDGPVAVGIVGSGYQARTQLESLAAVYRVVGASVYSPTASHRETFAREMTARLKIPVTAADSAEMAVRDKAVVAAASSNQSGKPAVCGAWLDRCRLLCAVGSTRSEQVEADTACYERAGMVVVDTLNAMEASGDLRAASEAGVVPRTKVATTGQVVSGQAGLPRDGLIVFKSVGTALQDLALAARCYEKLRRSSGVIAVPDVASLKSKV